MEILGTTQYVDLTKQKEPWYQLEVINMWDWGKKAVCYQDYGKTFITYCLKLNTPTSNSSYKSELVETITEEMREELEYLGYKFYTQ